jgi:hypothetical protein
MSFLKKALDAGNPFPGLPATTLACKHAKDAPIRRICAFTLTSKRYEGRRLFIGFNGEANKKPTKNFIRV